MPESDRDEIRRSRNELSCPYAFGEISHIPSGDRDIATTLGGVLDPMRGVIAVRLSLIALVSASSPDAVTKFGCGEIGRSGSSTSASASALSSRVKATLICFDFSFSSVTQRFDDVLSRQEPLASEIEFQRS